MVQLVFRKSRKQNGKHKDKQPPQQNFKMSIWVFGVFSMEANDI